MMGPLVSFDQITPISFWKFPVSELAQHLTYIHGSMFSSLKPREFIDLDWIDNDDLMSIKSPNLSLLITNLRRMSCWVATEIIRHKVALKRAKRIKFFIKLAYVCFLLSHRSSFAFVFILLTKQKLDRKKNNNNRNCTTSVIFTQ